MKSINVIDLFAGPGGLSEGFSSYSKKGISFKVGLSIEKDDVAYKTLLLRAFFRQFPVNSAPPEYYKYIRGEIKRDKLFETYPNEIDAAKKEVWHAELGSSAPSEVHDRVRSVTRNSDHWVLIGGPPCQAYSMVGRSRILGRIRDNLPKEQKLRLRDKIAAKYDKLNDGEIDSLALDFETKYADRQFRKDHRHELYKQYLEIVGVHQPTAFVMENVKGILSSKMKVGKALEYILDDLKDPWKSLEEDPRILLEKPAVTHGYSIYSFSVKKEKPEEFAGQDYIVKSEDFGIPQRRHRLFLLGVRDDVDLVPSVLEKATKQISVESVIGSLPRLRSCISRKPDYVEEWKNAIQSGIRDNLIPHIRDDAVKTSLLGYLGQLATDCNLGGAFISGEFDVGGEIGKWLTDEKIGGTIQHRARSHMPSDLVRYMFAASKAEITGFSPTLYDFPTSILPSHKNTKGLVHGKGRKDIKIIFEDRFRVQLADKPSTTITSHISKDGHYYIHYDPTQCRSLTGREAARLQTFPDNYFFEGNRTQQYEQIGNAVPPYLALQLADIVADLISKTINSQ